MLAGAVVGVAVLVGLVVWVVVAGVDRGTPTAVPTTAAPRFDVPGRLIVFDATTGRLGAARPDGTGFVPFSGPAFPANIAVASPDGRHVVVGETQVVDLRAGGMFARPTPLSSRHDVAGTQPFADHGTRVLLTSIPPGQLGNISTVLLDGGSRHSLGGDAGGAVGDPTRDGAVVAVQGDTVVNLGDSTQRNTSRVELRAWKQRTTVLATTRRLLDDAGLPPDRPYTVWPVVSPDGRFVALTIDELTANSNSVTAKHALVVTDRSGKVITSRTSFTGIQPVWNHEGTELAYLDEQGVVLVRISGDHAETGSIRGQVSGQYCLFSPTGDQLLCDDQTTNERFIATLADGQVDQVTYDSAHLAVAWLPAPGGGAG